MALSDEQIDGAARAEFDDLRGGSYEGLRAFARAIEAEVRKQDEALIAAQAREIEELRRRVEALLVPRVAEGEMALDIYRVERGVPYRQALLFTSYQVKDGPYDMVAEAARKLDVRMSRTIAAARKRLEGKP